MELLLNRTSQTCDIYVNGILNATTGHSHVDVVLKEMHLFSGETDYENITIAVSSGLNLEVNTDYNIKCVKLVNDKTGVSRLSIFNNGCGKIILITHINITTIVGLF